MELSQTDFEICKYLVMGKKNIEIARLLYLSEHTIKAHVSYIISAFGATNRTELAYILAKKNIIKV